MKLLRVGERNAERPALLDAQSNIRDLSAVIEDITPDWLANGGIATLFGIDVTALPPWLPSFRASSTNTGRPRWRGDTGR